MGARFGIRFAAGRARRVGRGTIRTRSRQEFLAGTDPRLATSGLRIIAVTKSGSDFGLSFSSVPGKTYRVEAKDALTLSNWMLLQDQIAASGTTTAITDFGATILPRRVYRVAVEP